MSLRETLEGARREASEAAVFDRKSSRDQSSAEPKQKAAATATTSATAQKSGLSRRSTARAKPTRERAASVHVAGASKTPKTKEEKKQDRQQKRDQEDLKFDAREALLKSSDEYARAHRIWLIMMGVGGAILLICFFISRVISAGDANINTILAVMSFFVIASYALIIASIVYDYRKIRPIRRDVEAQVNSMTPKRMRRVIADAKKREEAEKAAKGK